VVRGASGQPGGKRAVQDGSPDPRDRDTAGLAAAIYRYPALATVTETGEFLDAYATARGRPFGPGELQRCWAAGVWTRAFDARQEHAAGQPVARLTQDEASARLHRAGMG
jgi:hypothetical protein